MSASAFDTLLLSSINPRFYYEATEVYPAPLLTDYSGHGNSGTPEGTVGSSFFQNPGPTVTMNSYKFDGATTYVASSASAVPVTQVGAWFNSFNVSTPTQAIVSAQYVSGGQLPYVLFINSNGTMGWFQQVNGIVTGVASSNTVLSPNRWYFAVGTYDGANWNLYINGVFDSSSNATAPVGTTANPISTGVVVENGVGPIGNFFTGYLTRPWVAGGTVLTAAQVKALYVAGVGGETLIGSSPSVILGD